ncbi:MAG: hypothetical protein GX838_03180 [Clostridiaceae bacterium]|nr:hypothetical protein [Clostridiaceae bacterium]
MAGKRLGILRSFLGKAAINRPVNQVMEGVLGLLVQAGAVLIDIDDPLDSDWMICEVSVHLDDFRTHLDAYLAGLRPGAPVHSVR